MVCAFTGQQKVSRMVTDCVAVDIILLIPSYFKSSSADVDCYSVLICLFANDTALIIAVAPDQKIVM